MAELLGYNRFDFIKLLLHNRDVIVYCTKLARAQNDSEREAIEAKMLEEPKLGAILATLKGKASDEGATISGRMAKEARSLAKQDSKRSKREKELQMEAMELVNDDGEVSAPVSEYINLEELSFKQGGHLNSNKKQWSLPPGSLEKNRKGYDEVIVPATKAPPFAGTPPFSLFLSPSLFLFFFGTHFVFYSNLITSTIFSSPSSLFHSLFQILNKFELLILFSLDDEKLVKIVDLPKWAQPAFEGVRELNRMQSKVYTKIFEGSENILLCAPTGGGKTNCAMLAMLHEIGTPSPVPLPNRTLPRISFF